MAPRGARRVARRIVLPRTRPTRAARLYFQGVAVATAALQNVLRRSTDRSRRYRDVPRASKTRSAWNSCRSLHADTSRSVEQPDDRHIQVKEFTRSLRSDSDLRFSGIDANPRTSPAFRSDQPIPRRWRSEDLPNSLSVKRQGSQRHVSVIAALDHRSHVLDFIWGETSGDDSWAAWLVIEITASLIATPSVVARRGETRDSKRRAEW